MGEILRDIKEKPLYKNYKNTFSDVAQAMGDNFWVFLIGAFLVALLTMCVLVVLWWRRRATQRKRDAECAAFFAEYETAKALADAECVIDPELKALAHTPSGEGRRRVAAAAADEARESRRSPRSCWWVGGLGAGAAGLLGRVASLSYSSIGSATSRAAHVSSLRPITAFAYVATIALLFPEAAAQSVTLTASTPLRAGANSSLASLNAGYPLGSSSLGYFIAIPKTGGNSIARGAHYPLANEASADLDPHDKLLCPQQRANGKCLPTPGHFVDDVFRVRFKKETHSVVTRRPSFCIVRDPTERLWSALHSSQATKYNFTASNAAIAEDFSSGRFAVPTWTEQHLHMQPQSWYVWDDRGNVVCDCVVAFERIANLTSSHLNRGPIMNRSRIALPPELVRLYARDQQLHRDALSVPAPHLCWRPAAARKPGPSFAFVTSLVSDGSSIGARDTLRPAPPGAEAFAFLLEPPAVHAFSGWTVVLPVLSLPVSFPGVRTSQVWAQAVRDSESDRQLHQVAHLATSASTLSVKESM